MRVMLCVLAALTLCAPAAFADATQELVKSLQLIAAPAPVQQRHDWRVPHKVSRSPLMTNSTSPPDAGRPIPRYEACRFFFQDQRARVVLGPLQVEIGSG